jgi:polyisoprenoid-binding protein YceI
MIGAMGLRPGTHTVGPDSGTLRVNTYREGMAQKVGHDLIIDVGQWQAKVEVDEGGTPSVITLEADPRSLHVREGQRGVKPLTDRDRAEIRSNIDEKILRGEPIAFSSSVVQPADSRLTVQGELTIAGTTRPTSFQLDLSGDGRVSGSLSVTQSEWGIKPYRAFMGALKVRDSVEVVLDATLPTS